MLESQRIEEMTGQKLIQELQSYLDEFPFGPSSYLVGEGRIYTPAQIFQLMKQLLSDGFFGRRWPHHYLIVAGDGTGNEFCVDLNNQEGTIYLAEHERKSDIEDISFELVFEKFSAWLQEAQDIDASQGDWEDENETELGGQ